MKQAALSMLAMSVRLLIFIALLMLILDYGKTAYSFGYRVFSETPVSSENGVDVVVTIPMGSSVKSIGKILEDHGLIRDAKLFSVQERLSAYHGKLQSGTYTLSTSMTAEEMMAVMAEDDSGTEESKENSDSK
ncbi:MAG: endolytic transglycosylase MltG [Lachnospiraceae bacterium]|nr:endolytic transglycosylase MltG [Lachnospiraceae bacterium]